MLTQPLLDKLSQLGLAGFRTALEEQRHNPQYADLTFEERLGLLLDIEATRRANNRLTRRIQAARFPLTATMLDLGCFCIYAKIPIPGRARQTCGAVH